MLTVHFCSVYRSHWELGLDLLSSITSLTGYASPSMGTEQPIRDR